MSVNTKNLHFLHSPDRFDKFKALFKKFLDGTRWINQQMGQGVNVDRDKEDFNRLVIEPMEALWNTFSDEEKDEWVQVTKVIKLFNGRMV